VFKISWQTVPCSWSIDGEAALTGSSAGPAGGGQVISRVTVTFCGILITRL